MRHLINYGSSLEYWENPFNYCPYHCLGNPVKVINQLGYEISPTTIRSWAGLGYAYTDRYICCYQKPSTKSLATFVFIFPSPLNTINISFKSFPVFLCPLSVLFIISTSFSLFSLKVFFLGTCTGIWFWRYVRNMTYLPRIEKRHVICLSILWTK